MKKLLLVLCCALTLMAGCSKDGAQTGLSAKPAEKTPAPSINVVSMDNTQLSLDSLKGKVVVLNFWATWCPPCREEIPSMMALNKAMAGKPFQMVCVSVDEGGKQAVAEFFKIPVSPCRSILTPPVRLLPSMASPAYRKPL